jgi:hypothetical protein
VADFTFNVALGRVAELQDRVKLNDPPNSGLVVVPVDATGVADGAMKDCANLAAVIGLGVVDRSGTGGWTRKVLTDTHLPAVTQVNHGTDKAEPDIPDQVWVPGPTTGNVTDILLCYDADTTSGTDADILPMTCHDFVVAPNGTDVVWQLPSTGWVQVS